MIPLSVRKAIQVVNDWNRGFCPNVTEQRHCCVTTCPDCKRTIGPTLTGGPENRPLERKCSLIEPFYSWEANMPEPTR